MTEAFSLVDKVAIVTGGASGIGLETCRIFLKAGAAGIAMVDLKEETLSAAKASLAAELQDKVLCVAADVSREGDTAHYVEATVKRFGRLDISVQNAGIGHPRTSIAETPLEMFNQTMAVNTTGVFLGIKHSTKAMLASPHKGKGCSIIVTSSQLGLDGVAEFAGYCASKFAVRGLMACAAQELGQYGIRVNAVAPGPIVTPMTDRMEKHAVAEVQARTVFNRLGQSWEIATAMLFLASDASGYCTNSTLKVDGGYSKFA